MHVFQWHGKIIFVMGKLLFLWEKYYCREKTIIVKYSCVSIAYEKYFCHGKIIIRVGKILLTIVVGKILLEWENWIIIVKYSCVSMATPVRCTCSSIYLTNKRLYPFKCGNGFIITWILHQIIIDTNKVKLVAG